MASKTEICNLAISHLGSGKVIGNIETERSQEAAVCRLFYDNALESALRAFHWPFSTRITALGLVEEEPNSEWAYSYRYPSDCVNFRRIPSGTRNDSRQSRIPYRLANDDEGRILLTDKEDAFGEYTRRMTNPEYYPPDFVMAYSLLLAHLIAPRITGGDAFKMGKRAHDLYISEINRAWATSRNEEQDEEPLESEFVRAR